MPIFEYNGKKYNVKDEHIDSFMNDFPDASTIMERDGKKYRVRSADYRTFMSEQQGNEPQQPEQPAAAPTVPEVETPATPTGETPLTEQDKIRFSASIEQMKRRTQQSMDDFNERMATMREYHENAPLGGGQTAEGRMMFNPQSGKVEKTYITPLGNRYTSKGLADMESFRYRQAADMSVSGQLRRARLKLAELQAKRNERASEVHDETTEFNNTKLTGLGRALIGGQMYVGMQQSDPEKNALNVAIRQTEELIKDLEEQQDREQGKDVGFWRGFGRIAGDFRTWDFGMSDLSDAMTMMHADQLTDENATEGERAAYNEMMGAIYNKEQAEQAYGGNASFWNRAGVMTGYMPSFMLDFVITGGGFEGISLLSKGGTRAATKVIGSEVVEEMAEQGFKTYVRNNGIKGFGQYAGNWTIKALGTIGDDLLIRAPLMTNTVQFGKTTSDIIDRKLGDVVVNEDGTYDFSNDKTWGSAIWQGEANAIIENYSEMFGAHLDPVVTLGNMSKLANVVGAKRLGAVLSKADAGALSGIMGQTHQLFNKMGVSDYFGEVTEEYYGQMWRTMLNLDDAYQQNPDGTRTNLFATGQFHGDVWGGMALSMGLMGAGKHTLSAAHYTSMKHSVNKADAHATELLGKEVWEPLRTSLDLTTNEDMGAMAEAIVNDKDFTDDERAAVLTYMERSMMMRGYNLGTLAQRRGAAQDEDVQALDESYIDGYSIESSQEMNDAKNMYDYQRQRALAIIEEDFLTDIENDPAAHLDYIRNSEDWSDEERGILLDYLNSKQVYDGMIQRVRDDIDGRIDQSNAMVNARTNRTTGMIQGATMKQDDRRVYVINGNLVQYADGSGIDIEASDNSIIVRDAETGALEQVSPDAILNIDEALDPITEMQTAADAIRQQYAQEAANRIDGVVTFNPGDTYTITGDDAQIQVQIVANDEGIVDNGDGTVNVSDGTNVFPLAKETIQQQAEEAQLARVAQFEQQRAAENAAYQQAIEEESRPHYALNDLVSLRDENGNAVRGNITTDADADGRYEVYTEAPINGKRVNLFTRDELDSMLMEHNGVVFEQPADNEGNNGGENIPESGNNAPQNIPAMQRIPKDMQGNPLYEQTDSDTAWDAIVEQTEGDEAMERPVLVNMLDVDDAEAITLGQFVAQDTESGGTERIKPKNALQKMGNDMRSFANLLLKSNDEDTSFAGLVDNNGVEVLKWMSQRGYITPTQYKSAFDSKGNLTAEAKNDLRGIMYQSIFKGGSTRLEEMFNAMPAKAQKAILATAFRDYDSPNADRMIEEIQNSIRAFYALSQSEDFVNAKTFKDARLAVEGWKIQYQIDDVTGESYLPAENFSNFALLLATMYKGENQSVIQGTFNKLYDLIQGTQEPNLFEQPDNTPRSLAQAIYETLNITYDGQQRSNVLVGDSSASQRGQQGSTGDAATGERVENGERTADSAGSIEAESTTGGETVHQPQPERKGLEQTSDVGRKGDSTGVADDATQEVLGASNRGDIRVLEEGLDTSYSAYSDDSERTRRTAESERLVSLAKQHGLFIPAEVIKTLTGKVAKRTGESVVYIDTAAGKVTKVKDPYAKAAMKSGVQPEDAAFEHRVHNLLFPETAYTLEGISEEMGDVRIVLSQDFIQNYDQPTKEQIAEALAARGLFPEDNYSFGNELVSVTDVEGDNVLLGEDGTVYFIDPIIRFKKPLREILAALGGAEQKAPTIGEQIQAAEAEVNTNPTEAQKEAGNYKKGHVQIGTFNVTIEQPKGSVRSGVDKGGKKWEVEMQNTYGYIRGTEGVDGDHIDVFLSDDIDGWDGHKVFVVDQRNADGSFDEHKVMLGFNDINDAEAAYMSNYEEGWQGLGAITGVSIEEFEKWIASSHRKTKAFAEYKSVKTTEGQSASTDKDLRRKLADFNVGDVVRDYYNQKLYRIKKHSTNGVSTIAELDAEGNEVGTTTMNAHNNSRYSLAEAPVKAETPTISQESEQVSDQDNAPYTIAPAQYTTKKGKVLDMHLVKFAGTLTKEQQRAAKELAKADKGWYDREQGGFMMRSEESAKQLADTILGNEEAVSEAQPVSMTDIQALNNGDVLFTEPQQVEQTDIEEKSPVWQYSIHVDKETGRTTLRRDDVSGVYPIGDARWQHTAASPEEMLDILRNPLNGMQDVLEAVGVTLENKIKTRELDRKSKEQAPTAETNPSGNRLVTDERYAELRERMRKKLGGQMNIGIDPEILAIGTEMAVYHLEKGARKFTEFAKAMVADLGDVIRPYLKAFYNGARNLPEVESSEIATDMTSYDEVQTFDIANFDKPGIDAIATAETVTREAEVAQEVEVAQERIKKTRSAKKETKKKTVTSQQSSEMGLFDGLFDNETNNDNGLQRTDAERSEGVSANGNRHEQGLSRGTETSSESEQQGSRGTDLGGERTGDAVDRTVRPRLSDTVEDKGIEGKRKKDVENNRKLADELKGVTLFVPDTFGVEHELSGFTYYELENVFHFTDNINGQRNATRKELDAILKIARKNNGKEEISEPKNTRNNHSERGKDHAPTSVDARIEANIKAIELAKQLLESGEQATEKQMQTLRKFSGWGGLGKAFSEGTYYAPNLIAKRLRELLGEAAYQEAVMSANSAYYTPAYVVDTLWDIAEQMGFKGGNILEGSAGIGNILGQMPTHISERSNIHAIEIDGTSGGILSLLYPDAKVEIQGFEETRIANGSVDLAITNVPFVTGLRVNDTTGDKDLSKKFHNIHDFCIAKNVRKLREGGLGIFITSNGTLDNSKKLRDWIVNEGGADFVGAFRMHNKTFGGTGVTSDIIVIRKRVNGKKSANAIDVSTVTGERMAEYDTGETRKVKGQIVPVVKQLSMDYNQYFVEHPENMAGEMHFAFEKGDTFRPTSKGLYPKQEKKQEQMLAEFVQSFTAEEFGEKATDEIEVIDAMPGKKIGEVFVSDGKLYINAIGAAQPLEVNANKVKGHTKVECFEAYSAIKEALAAVLEYQITHEDDKGLKPLLAKLNKAYDDFVATYGHFNKNTAIAFLRNDVDYANVFALEKFEESADAKGNKVQKFGKTDVFSKRVIEKEAEPMPTNVKDGIVASIFKFGRVDIPYIAEQLGKSEAEVKAEIIESGYGFEDPASRQVEVSYQYLSGNVREKLRQAQENNENGEFDRNIKALQEVMPMTIPAHLIDFTLGSSWIEPKLYEEYVKERTDVGVQFTAVGGTWFMNEPYYTAYEKNRAMGVTSEMLGRTVMGHTLIEAAIQNKSITVSTVKKNWDGSTETITDKEATQACSAKIDEIRQDFKEWARQKMQSDAEMSERMERVYNDTFNNYVPMSIPDEFVPEYFGGASHKFKMRSHQGRAIVRGTMQPLLLAHEVGTGKTFTLISTAMEMRRLGTARKPMIVVQNATVGQFVASAKELYPNAKILTLEEADRSAEGRKNFYAKIKYNDWDMIVVPQSTFEFIPDSEERQMAFVQEKIEEKMLVLEQMKEADPDGKSMITRQAEREIALLEEELAGLSGETGKKRTANDEKKRAVALQNAEVKAMEMLDRRTDDVENFDDMGIDALLIDEAHEYKHLGFATAMQRGVKGVDPSYSKKSQGVFLKTQAVLEKNNGRNVIFATGTPISNTAAEIWTFMRYLMPADTMKEYGIYYFDDFVRNFGNIQQMLEFTTSGKFKENNRFAGYVNLPELVRIWSGVSDTVLTKEAGGVSDKIPDMEGGKAQDLYLPQTRALRSIMKYVKAELERYDKMSGKEKKENSHIPLTMYGIAKAAAVDARLVQSDAEDDTQSKTNEAVRQTLRSLQESADYKGTVAIFADNYQNKESGFNLYEDIRTKLIAEGVPADEIVVIKSGMTVKKKLEIFEKVNRGEVRVILGSTFTLGTGVNIQERLYTLIHLDAPNRPMDYTQRNGRILRQGNLHKAMGKPVRVLRFGVEDSLDVTAYQRLKTKGAIADSIMNGKQMMANSMTNRVLEEEEDVFGDTVAQLSGSEYAMLKNNAEKNVRKYASRKKQWEADQTYIHNAKPRVKAFIKDAEKRIEDNSRYLEAVRASFPDGKFKEIVIGKHRFATIEAMEDFFKEHNKSLLAEMKQMKDGDIAGEQKRQLTIQIGDFSFVVTTKLTRQTVRDGATLFNDVERKMTYSCAELGIENIPVRQNLLRNAIEDITNNVITGRDFAERVEIAERVKKHNETELEQLLSREGKPFEYEAELEQAQTQYEEFSELMKKELAEKEAKYAEMDAGVTAADNLSTADEADELEREGDGAYTDDEVSFENDPISKVLGKPRFTRKQRREFAERERQRMVARVENLAKKLNLDNVEIVTDASTLEGKKQRAKGFYTKSTGKITIVIPNHSSTLDVEQTLLHEAVAHYGLRQLFGEHFDTFLDNVFNNADEAIRQRIVALAAKNGWDFHKATEEYLAMLAENTEFENTNASWWRQIKDFFLNMLHKIGFEDFRGVTLTDNELRYILWRSYENLAEPGKYRSILGEAADVAKQYELGVGNYAVTNPNTPHAAESDDELYRDGDPEIHERELARDRYERRVKTGMFQSQEALQDSMLGLKEAMQAILGQGTNIEDVDGFENAYLGENRLSSVNKAEADAFAQTLFKPMLDEVAKLALNEAEREELTDYMMAKHGLERNAYMRNEAIKNGATDADQTDYAGLTALTGMDDVADAEAEAQRMVDDYEQAHETADLWEKVNAVSKAILQKPYECGMMSKETFDKVSDMYEFYIPLRGFDEKTSAEAYAYLSHKHSAFNAPIKKAEGRRSKADDPFANLQSMAEGAIMQGNRNKLVKQRFLNFALNHPSDLVSVSDIWVEYDAVTDEWKPVFPDNIESTDTPEEVEQKMQDFETKMESLAQQHPDQYKRGKDAIGIPYRIVESRDMRQHQVVVKRGGRDYVITINGNPRAAQALNGQTNPDNDMSGAIGAILRAGEKINRQLSAFYTTRNPDFIVSNFMRDMLYTNSMAWIKESPNYALRFHRNYLMVNPVTMKRLLAKYRKGTLDMSNKTEAMFHQFMMNGGETGYANIRDIEQHKNDIRKELKRANGKLKLARAWSLLAEKFDELNRAVENCARFAAFVTSREMGRSIDRAIYDAKEISVNFNKKGSGAKFYDSVGQTKAGNASALVSGLGRSGYVFWNAAIQGTTNFGRQMKRHPAKAFTGMAAMFLLGAIVAYFGGDDDEDDKNAYYNLPEYVRRSNILFRAGDSWISIPLPIEYRAFYGMGELMTSVFSGKEHLTGGEIAEAVLGQATQILPIDFLEGGGGLNAFVPSAAKPLWEAYVAEKSWTGMPLYKDTPFNKDMPEWTKAYSSTNKHIVNLAATLNEATGGDPYTKGAIDINPAKVEYMLNGYFGGVFGTIDKLTKTAETIVGDREYDPRSILLVNRLVKAGDERTEYRAVNNEYFRLKEEHDRLKTRLRHYEEDTDNGIFDYAEKIDFLYNSPEYERYEIFEDYRKDIDDLYDEMQEAVDDEERKDIEAELNELKKEMIQEMNTTRKRK